MQPERALRLLDALDGLAGAVRLVCIGYWGRRLRAALIMAAVLFVPATLLTPYI